MTLETAKALKSAGWDKETEWGYCGVVPEYVSLNRKSLLNPLEFERMFYPCPSLEEILAELPDVYRGSKKDHAFELRKLNGYLAHYGNELIAIGSDPAEACAMLWIKLKQEGLLA